MKLIEALKIAQSPAADGSESLRVFLGSGFTPLHLQTFLAAHLRLRLPGIQPEISTGLFGDLIGSIERLRPSEVDVLVIAVEWSDLDTRLGTRSLGGWRPADMDDVAVSVQAAAGRLQRALETASRDVMTVVSLPTLPLPPAFNPPRVQIGSQEAQLHRVVARLVESLSAVPGIRTLSAQRLADVSVPAARYDIKSDLLTGFPYTLGHASALGELLALLVENRPPLKGLITDLDDTLWSGIVGEDGVDGISWSLDDHSHIHGVYQQFLSSLTATGVLVGVASKNDPDMVARAFERGDLLLSKDDAFPFEIHWSRKSESVRRILNAWNISAETAVFIDDSPAEIAEVQAVFPELTCRVFPKNDPAAIWALLGELRDLFGKSAVSEEDSIRLRSIRNSAAWRSENGASQAHSDDFFRSAEARIVLECGRMPADTRAFELVNKTNQFNLNGERYSEPEWRQFFADPSAFLLTATYEDKYGALGKVAALLGTTHAGSIRLQSWAMSCRAFSRRIEHQCLRFLFDELEAQRISFEYTPTPRNGPMRDFLESLTGSPLEVPLCLMKDAFFVRAPHLFHRVEVSVHA